jgi:hypothetical protein
MESSPTVGLGHRTAKPRRLCRGMGTSFSAPLVAGGVALLNQLDSVDTQGRALRAFSTGSHPEQFMGLGLIDLYQACLYRATHSVDQ